MTANLMLPCCFFQAAILQDMNGSLTCSAPVRLRALQTGGWIKLCQTLDRAGQRKRSHDTQEKNTWLHDK